MQNTPSCLHSTSVFHLLLRKSGVDTGHWTPSRRQDCYAECKNGDDDVCIIKTEGEKTFTINLGYIPENIMTMIRIEQQKALLTRKQRPNQP